MTPLDDVRAVVLSHCGLGPIVVLPATEAHGLVLAADVVATEPVPPFDNTAVDGYAVRAQDVARTPVTLDVIGELAAGGVATDAVREGTAIRIMTGAPIPEGCDAVVMVEDTERVGNSHVAIHKSAASGDAIRRAGSDVQVGVTVLTQGVVVTPMVEGVLASINAGTVSVYRRPRVGILSTGDELVDDGSPLQPGQIRESNRTMLRRIIAETGADVLDIGIVRDDESVLEQVLRDAVNVQHCDALVTSGGVSMGDYDVVKAVLGRIASMQWFQVAMKPAKPFAFGTLTNDAGVAIPVFGLPGNPVSSLMSFELLARPALKSMMGSRHPYRARVHAIVDEDVTRKPDGKTHFDRVHAYWGATDGRVHVRRTGPQGSHQLAATAVANAIMAVPDGVGVRAGDEVTVSFLGPESGPHAS
ncbi:MAG: molybdopterin molybdenumtransferase MoeA [Actinobacteria bacterium]|nr:molybdopterin molybdenumtransferase MoeA [Actinomycetota bacterium]